MQLTEAIEQLDQKTFPFNRYKPIEKLGHGESGRAFLCFDQFMEQDVVVKTMGSVELDKLIEFQRDATLLCRLNHRGLAQVLDFGCTALGTVYIVSEYHPGINLHRHISDGQPLPLDLALKTFTVIADVLAQMHVHGVLHRDLKTSNILVRNLDAGDSAIFLLDAGTGRVKLATMQPNIFEGREVPGDPNYMSPEYAARLHYDSRSEIFALGCTLFEALTGRTPFVGAESLGQLARRNAPSLTQVSKGISYPYRMETFIAKCLARSPESRFQSMPEVSQALKELVKLQLSVEQVVDNFETADLEVRGSHAHRHSSPILTTAPVQESNSDNFYQEEHPVRLVNTDWMESSSDLSDEMTEGTETETETANNKKRSSRRSRHAKSPSLDSGSIAAPDVESLAYFAASNIAFAKPEPKRKTKTSANTSTTVASPVVADKNDSAPGLANSIKRIYNRMISYHLNSEYSAVSIVVCALVLLCAGVSISYISYLTAPSVEIKGTVVGYRQAAGLENGMLELAAVDDSGIVLSTTKMLIESPEQNLPKYGESDAVPINTFASDLSNQRVWEEETLNLDGLSLPSKPITSDIVIGQRWDVVCRKQWDGKLIVEKLKAGIVPYSQENFEQIHLVISKMVKSIANSQPASEADPAWAADDFVWGIELSPNQTEVPTPTLFPASNLKLKEYNSNECVMMMKPPSWMTNSKYLKITLGRFLANWRVMEIEECSQAEWNHEHSE